MRGSDALLTLLADEGVTHLFGNPGTTELPLMAAFAQNAPLDYVLAPQEAAVVAMADGYARASGRLAACNVHVAPGLGNALGSVFNASWIGSPIIVTAGQHPIGHGLTEPMLYAPLEPLARPFVKWAVEVTRLVDLPRTMRRAAKIATAPPTGPVFVSLPGNVLTAEAELDLGRSHRVDASTRPTDATVERLASMLRAAERPAMICGHEVNVRRGLGVAGELAELIGAAVYHDTVQTAATFVSTHPCYLGVLSRNQQDVAERLAAYDIVMCLGTDLLRMSLPASVSPRPDGVTVVQIGEREEDLAKNYPTELAIQANVTETLTAVTTLLRTSRTADDPATAATRVAGFAATNWTAQRKELVASIPDVPRTPIDPTALMARIVDRLPDDAILVDEGLTSTTSLLRLFPCRDAGSYFGLASGGIGFAVAGAVGIRLALPGRPLVAIIGDGSALYNIQALWTAANLRLPMVYVIANNGGYRILKQRVRAHHGVDRFVGMDFDDPRIDFAALARSMGVRAETISDLAALDPALTEALTCDGPTLLDVVVDGRV